MGRTLPPGAKLVLASHNPGKLREIAELMEPLGVAVVSAGSLGLPEPDEGEESFEANARIKALAAATASGLPALSDDSGFCVGALGGAPGVVSALWAGPGKDFGPAMQRVRRGMGESADTRAWFVCVLCLAWPDGHAECFEGRVDGSVAWPPRGANGHGYDPMFVPEGGTLTYGEMDQGEKHATSHRARAFAKLVAACFAR
jgi:non-canonical purine NTP pyrophosphatase (RdgB/HAM1 family)